MKNYSLFLISLLLLFTDGIGQKSPADLGIQKGQKIEIQSHVKSTLSQQAAGQVMQFNLDGGVTQLYDALDATPKGYSMHLSTKRVHLTVDGMGQSVTFDSDNKENIEELTGGPLYDALKKTYELTLDRLGTVINAKISNPDSIQSSEASGEIVVTLLKSFGPAFKLPVQPQQGEATIFKILPGKEISKGESWNDSTITADGKEVATYTLTDITGTEILIDFISTSNTDTKSQMMGLESTTKLTNKSTGKISIDKITRIPKQKSFTTESTGFVDVMNQNVPITIKTTTVVDVRL